VHNSIGLGSARWGGLVFARRLPNFGSRNSIFDRHFPPFLAVRLPGAAILAKFQIGNGSVVSSTSSRRSAFLIVNDSIRNRCKLLKTKESGTF
jgi:hypothetical protein